MDSLLSIVTVARLLHVLQDNRCSPAPAVAAIYFCSYMWVMLVRRAGRMMLVRRAGRMMQGHRAGRMMRGHRAGRMMLVRLAL